MIEDVLVTTCQGEVEAQIFKSYLENAGIPCRMQGEALRLTHMFTVDGLGAVRCYVPATFADAARAILDALEAGELALESADIPEDSGKPPKFRELP